MKNVISFSIEISKLYWNLNSEIVSQLLTITNNNKNNNNNKNITNNDNY